MKSSHRAGIVNGAVVGVMLTAALLGISYLAWRLAGLPFVAFDVFDWMGRMLPGSIVTFGIDAIVGVIRSLNLGATAETAKTVEQTIAITGLLITGTLAGAVSYALVDRLRHPYLLGVAAGAAVGVPVTFISHSVSQTAVTGPVSSAVWILLGFLIWGAALGWSYQRLSTADHAAEVMRIDRRRFLVRLGGATALVAVTGAVVGELAVGSRRREIALRGRWSANHALPNAAARVKPAPGTRPEFTPLERHYRIDINTTPPAILEDSWRLRIRGLVDSPLVYALDDLRTKYEPLHQFVTLACISNPIAADLIGTTRWTGVSLQRLLPDWRLKPQATHLKLTSADGFFEVVPLETIKADERVMLTYAWDGVPLTAGHGFPLRIYIPDHYGMKQPKWIESIEAIDHWEPGYWVTRGWDAEARMKATSVIDTVAVDRMIDQADGAKLVPIGGIAHAGARGISRVEMQVDGEEWHEAQLRTPLSGLTWVVWRYDWPFREGRHTFTVRCYDGDGTPQTVAQAAVRPAGASGLHSRTVAL